MIRGITRQDLSEAAIEIDNYLIGKPYNFKILGKVKKFLKKEDMNFNEERFYWRAFSENSQKGYKYVGDIKLEKRLMLYELERIKSLSKERANEIVCVLCNMSKYASPHLMASPRYLAALI